MPITSQQLLQILPNAGRQAGVFVPVLNTAMNRYGWLFSLPVSANYVIQEFRSEADGSLHTRAKIAGAWQAWRMTYNTGNTTRAADGTLKAI